MFHRRAPWWSYAQGHLFSSVPHKRRRSPLPALPLTFFNVSPIGQFTFNRTSETFSSSVEHSRRWCCTIATMLSQAPGRDSQDFLLLFPGGCFCSMLRTIVCCLCLFVRVTFTTGVGNVAKIARWWPPGPFKRWLLSFFLSCFAHALSSRWVPSFRSDTAAIRSSVVVTVIPHHAGG